MVKKWLKLLLMIVTVSVGIIPFIPPASAGSQGVIHWGEVQTGVYSELHPYTLNWSGDVLDKGGLNLSTMKVTAKSDEADLVINQYGAIGASGILKLDDEQLQDLTSRSKSGFVNSYMMAKGDLYLIIMHDGKYAKLRIDRVLPEQGLSIQKVYFSYVLEGEPEEAEEEAPFPSASISPSPGMSPSSSPSPSPSPTPGTASPATTPTLPLPAPNPVVTSQPGEQSLIIRLEVNSVQAVVQGKLQSLEVPPTMINGTTLVPIRFIAESMGVKVEWDDSERKVTLIQKNQNIQLWIDSVTAVVNGNTVKLEVPPAIINGTTMVPIRFVSESYNQKVEYEPITGTIFITGMLDAPEGSAGEASAAFPDSLYGTWEMLDIHWMEDYRLGGIGIRSNGTYVQKKKDVGEVEGVWRMAEPKEVEGFEQAIILQYGVEKTDWALVVKEDGTIGIYQSYLESPGGLYGGQKIGWLELYKGRRLSYDPADVKVIPVTDYDYTVFVGSWSLWIEGGATNLYDTQTGSYATHEYTPGADGGKLTVYADGTYTMETNVTVTGLWRSSRIDEVYGYNWSIILENGPDGIDWAMLVNSNGKKMVSYDTLGTWSDGSKIWLPYYAADKIQD